MNARERSLAAMHNQPVDRPPVSFWQHAGADEQRGKASVEMHLRFMRETGVDFLKVMNDGYRAPFDTESIKTADDWYRPVSYTHLRPVGFHPCAVP